MQKENIQFLVHSNSYKQSSQSLRNSVSTTPKHHKFNSTIASQRHPLSNTYSSNALAQNFSSSSNFMQRRYSQSPLNNFAPPPPQKQQQLSQRMKFNQSQKMNPSSSVSLLISSNPSNNNQTSKGQSVSQVAAMKKDVLSLNKQLQSLSKQHQKLNSKHTSATAEMKKLRQDNESMKEELIFNKRILQKQGSEKIQLEDVISKNKEYIRKLERTVTRSASGTALADANLNLSAQNERLRQQNERMKSRIVLLEQKQRSNQEQIQVLARALEIKVQDFNLNDESEGSNDFRSSLLYDVGQSREEIKKLKQKLIQVSGKIQILQIALQREQTKNEQLQIIRESNNKAFIKVEEELLTAKSNAIRAQKSNQQIEQQRVALLQYVEQIQAASDQQLKRRDQQITEKRKHIQAMQEANVEASKSIAQLELKLQDSNKKLMDCETVNSSIAKQYENQKNHIAQLQKNYESVRDQKVELVSRCAEIQSELKTSQKRQETLRKQHQNAIQSIEQQRKQYQKIVMKAQDLQYTLRVTAQAQEKSQIVMQEKMETTLSELQSVAKERNLLKNQVHDAVKACQFSQKEGNDYKIEGQRYKERLDSLINSKNVMQRTLTDQLQSMEQLVNQSKNERRIAKLDNQELSTKIRDTQQKNRQLLEEVRKLRKYHNTMNSMHH